MNLRAEIIQKEDWINLPPHLVEDQKDYNFVVLISQESSGEWVGYTKVKELDSETALLTFFKLFGDFRSQGLGVKLMQHIIDSLFPMYKRIGYSCSTKNIAAIKIGFEHDFEIIGMRLIDGVRSLELLLERTA